MDTFEQFRLQLRDALTRLNDPEYGPSELLASVVGSPPQDGGGPIQSALIGILDRLRKVPSSGSELDARALDTLHLRYVRRMTQEEVAEELHVSDRHLRRLQREATHVLARILWEHHVAHEVAVGDASHGDALPDGPVLPRSSTLDWRSQLTQDLTALQRSVPGAVTDVGDAILGVLNLERALVRTYEVDIRVGHIETGLGVPVHASALRQILIGAIGQFARRGSLGPITVGAERVHATVTISVSGPAPGGGQSVSSGPLEAMLTALGGTLDTSYACGSAQLRIGLPAAGEATVLVVEDNQDLVHFYRRCALGTRYSIISAAGGQPVIEFAQTARPDVIVLDVMLPGIDGWELLTQLHAHPATRSVPVIVCSVIREEDLALALGAVLYLPKPVQPEQFVQALDDALKRVSGAGPAARAESQPAG